MFKSLVGWLDIYFRDCIVIKKKKELIYVYWCKIFLAAFFNYYLIGFSSSNNFLLNFNIKKAKSILEFKKNVLIDII